LLSQTYSASPLSLVRIPPSLSKTQFQPLLTSSNTLLLYPSIPPFALV
jgi:hypothetical protein